jgi:hypothetical protein
VPSVNSISILNALVERLTPPYVPNVQLMLLEKSLGYKYRGARKGGKKMTIQLNEIVLNNYCRYDLHSGCVRGEEDTLTCARCVADAAAEIVRVQL